VDDWLAATDGWKRGESEHALALRLGYHPGTILRWVTGRSTPRSVVRWRRVRELERRLARRGLRIP